MNILPPRGHRFDEIPMANDPDAVWVENVGLKNQLVNGVQAIACLHVAIYVLTEYQRRSYQGIVVLIALLAALAIQAHKSQLNEGNL